MAGKGHVGKAGQLAVMSEFLLRGYNVAMPEVDVGDDIFVVQHTQGQMWRIQVKTALAKRGRKGYRAKFAVNEDQLSTARIPDLFYVLALRKEDAWEFLVLRRAILKAEVQAHGAGSTATPNVVLSLLSSAGAVTCSGRDWTAFRGDWGEWPLID